MFALIILILFGVVIAFFAIDNTGNVTVDFFNKAITLPVYLVVLTSALFGILLSWILHLVNSAYHAISMFGKNKTIHSSEKTITELNDRIHDLEIENARLRAENRGGTKIV